MDVRRFRVEKGRDRERFDAWSSTYEQSFTWRHFFEPVHRTMMGEIGDVAGRDILDLGCGTGDLLRRCAAAGAGRLAGIDPSEGMLAVARQLSGGYPNIDFFGAPAESLPFGEGEFDIVTSCIAFHHFPDPHEALAEAARVLRPAGKLYVSDMCSEGLAGKLMLAFGRAKAADDHYFTRSGLTGLLRDAGFEPGTARNVNRFPPAMLLSATRR